MIRGMQADHAEFFYYPCKHTSFPPRSHRYPFVHHPGFLDLLTPISALEFTDAMRSYVCSNTTTTTSSSSYNPSSAILTFFGSSPPLTSFRLLVVQSCTCIPSYPCHPSAIALLHVTRQTRDHPPLHLNIDPLLSHANTHLVKGKESWQISITPPSES